MSDRLTGAQVAHDLRELTRALVRAGHTSAGAGLGGELGYGVAVEGPVFTMRPYSWEECECGFEQADVAFWDTHRHHPTCFQVALTQDHRGARELARAWGLDFGDGCATHCTCATQDAYDTWAASHDHTPDCCVRQANFVHHTSGCEVRWYKYLGRSMEITGDPTAGEWAAIMTDCLAHLPAPAPSVRRAPGRPSPARDRADHDDPGRVRVR